MSAEARQLGAGGLPTLQPCDVNEVPRQRQGTSLVVVELVEEILADLNRQGREL